MLNVKQGSCEYQLLKSFGLTRPGNLFLAYRLRGERSNHWATRRLIDVARPIAFVARSVAFGPCVFFCRKRSRLNFEHVWNSNASVCDLDYHVSVAQESYEHRATLRVLARLVHNFIRICNCGWVHFATRICNCGWVHFATMRLFHDRSQMNLLSCTIVARL